MPEESVKVPNNFLPPTAPASAQAKVIDFESTNPPLPQYRKLFAAVIDDFLTESECQELLRLAEATTIQNVSDGSRSSSEATTVTSTPIWERAMVNIGGGRQAMMTDVRNCGRIIWDSETVAQKLFDRLGPYLRSWGIDTLEDKPLVTYGSRKTFTASRLNERLRFLKYQGGEYFRPHQDGCYETPDGKEMSYYTIHLYLNGSGQQNMEELLRAEAQQGAGTSHNEDTEGELLGGATSFLGDYGHKDPDRVLRIFPRAGSILVFQHLGLRHSGDPVFRGTKYTVRTDIMYKEK